MSNKLVVLNEDKNDCAAACLSSIIIYYNGYLDMESIKEIINTNQYGTNAYDLINGAKEIGFNAYGKKVTLEYIQSYQSSFPVIAHVKKGNMYHFVVIYKIDTKRNKILYMDPSVGFINASLNEFGEIYLSTLLFFNKVRELPKLKRDNLLLKEILVNVLKDKKTLLLLLITSFICFILSLFNTYYYKLIIESTSLSKSYYIKLLYIFSIFTIIKNIFSYIKNKLSIQLNYNIEMFINSKMTNKIFDLPYTYYKNKTTGEIVSRFNDLESLRELLLDMILNTFLNIFLITISFVVMFVVNYKLALIGILIIFIYYSIVRVYRNIFDRKIRVLQENKGMYNSNLMESIDGLESIRNLCIKNLKLNNLSLSYKNMCDTNKSLSNDFNKQQFLKDLIYDIGTIIFLTIGMFYVINSNMIISNLILMYILVSYFIGLVKNILDKDVDINYNLKNLEKINTILSNEEEEVSNLFIRGDIVINNLSYKYSDKLVLDNINLKIKENSRILIYGKSGSGKSTFIKIILKYLKDYNGNITINNVNYKSISSSTINNSFTYVGQNERLFIDTFKNNIILNRDIGNDMYEKIINICELKNVRRRDDELIMESGFNLSGGEKQRIILARALLKNSNYLILDEALSEVDTVIEKKIIKNIFKEYPDKTIIYVSHKKETQDLFKIKYDIERR